MKIFLSLLLGLMMGTLHSQDSLNYYYQTGMESMKSGDLSTYARSFESANQLRPYHPTIVYHLARANALLDKKEETFNISKIMLMMKGDNTLLEDSVFNAFRNSEFSHSLKKLEADVTKQINTSSLFMEFSNKSLHPESLALVGDQLYIGGVHDRKIISINSDGSQHEVIDYKSQENLYAVMGLAYDEKNKLIWACTAAMPEMVGYSEDMKGMSSVLAINEKGEVIKSISLNEGNLFGDLTVSSEGKVYISDGLKNSIYTISLDEPLEEAFKIANQTYNLQGLTLNEDETELFIADYIMGLFNLNLSTGALNFLKLEGDIIGKGFDGLYFYENSLIGIQNGTTPERVWRLYLNSDGDIERQEIIDQALEIFGEPTQGLIDGDKFIYIANSPWGYYEHGKFKVDEVPNIVLLQNEL